MAYVAAANAVQHANRDGLNDQQRANLVIMKEIERQSNKRRVMLENLLSLDEWLQRPRSCCLQRALDGAVARTDELGAAPDELSAAFREVAACPQLKQLRAMQRKYAETLAHLERRIAEAQQPIFEFAGWREEEEHDELGGRAFVNEEGLVRVDCPPAWCFEERRRASDVMEARDQIYTEEARFVDWMQHTLGSLHDAHAKALRLLGVVEQRLSRATSAANSRNDLDRRVATSITDIADGMKKLLEHFEYTGSGAAPLAPTVTLLAATRRGRTPMLLAPPGIGLLMAATRD